MNIKELQALFPSQDGNPAQQQLLLNLLSKVVRNIDSLKDPQSPMLGHLEERKEDYYNEFIRTEEIPFKGVDYDTLLIKLKELANGHPYASQYSMQNVSSLANIPSLLGNLTMLLLDGNTVWDVVGPAAAEAEVKVVSMMAKLVGYDPHESWGYTTWGGQGAVFTGLRLAIAKHYPDSNRTGIPRNLYCFASESSHYSLLKSVEATGIGTDHLITIRTNDDHSMDLNDLKEKMIGVVREGGVPLYIVATMGSTDSFSIDDIQGIKDICLELEEEHQLQPIRIHADSAIGGLYTVFNQYDFKQNPLQFEREVLDCLQEVQHKIEPIRIADTLCFDFHKLGSTPYTSSLLLVKNGIDLKLVDLDAESTPYVGNRGYGSYHTSYTLECSRMGSAITIYASLLGLGIESYQYLFGHYTKVHLYLRKRIKEVLPYVGITNEHNYGAITTLRFYRENEQWERESNGLATQNEIEETNRYNQMLFEIFGANRDRFFLGDTTKQCSVWSKDTQTLVPVSVLKIVTLSPYTDLEHIDDVVNYIEETVKKEVPSLLQSSYQ